jgi:hypothetical protein
MNNRSIGTDHRNDPDADFTIRDGIGGATILDRDGNAIANARSASLAVDFFVAGAAAAGKSVYDQRTGRYIAGTLDQLTAILGGLKS